VPSDGTAQEAYQYTGIVKADSVNETWPKRQSVDIKQPKRQSSPRGKAAQEAKQPKRQSSPRGKAAQEAKQPNTGVDLEKKLGGAPQQLSKVKLEVYMVV
jgi:hypothetical protein